MKRAANLFAIAAAAVIGASCIVTPRALRKRGPAPTMSAPDSPELAQGASGTLIAVRYHGDATLVDLPSLRRVELDLGRRVSMVAGPDEAGRIVYEARAPKWWEFFPITLFTASRKCEVLFVRSLRTGEEKVLREYRPYSYSGNRLDISRRGGKVLSAVYRDLRVYDVGGRELFRTEEFERNVRDPWLDDDGAFLHFEQIEPQSASGPRIPWELRRWLPVSVDLTTGEVRVESTACERPVSPWRLNHWAQLWCGSASRFPKRADWPAPPTISFDELPGQMFGVAVEVEGGVTLYPGLASPNDGARCFPLSGGTEHSIRLGQRSTGKTLNLVKRFEPGAWTVTDVRLDPSLFE